jgi:8-amino-7-oxononanoate synthase
VPVVTGSSIRAGLLAQALFARGINAQPILYPAVPERAARLRFFVTAGHGEAQLREAARIVIEESQAIAATSVDLAALTRDLSRQMPD